MDWFFLNKRKSRGDFFASLFDRRSTEEIGSNPPASFLLLLLYTRRVIFGHTLFDRLPISIKSPIFCPICLKQLIDSRIKTNQVSLVIVPAGTAKDRKFLRLAKTQLHFLHLRPQNFFYSHHGQGSSGVQGMIARRFRQPDGLQYLERWLQRVVESVDPSARGSD